MGNGHGGTRENAGRTPGSANLKNREIANKRAESGLPTPLEVILKNMDFYDRGADELLGKLLTELTPAAEAIAASSEDPEVKAAGAEVARVAAIDSLKAILGLRERAGEAAHQAAPFMHARLQPVDGGAGEQGNDHVPLADRLKAYATREAIEASAGKVVAIKG